MARYEDTKRNSGLKKESIIAYLDQTIANCNLAIQYVNDDDYDFDYFLRILDDIIRLPLKLKNDMIENQKILDKYRKKK